MSSQRTATDPVTREVILSGFRAAILEMEVLIGRAAMSPVIKDKKDYFMGLYDAHGRMIHALTSYSGPGLARPVLERYHPDDIKPGDIFFYNDPYSTDGAVQHMPDIVVLMPFHRPDETLLGFAVAFGHLEDIGGLRYGSGAMEARDIFNEGIAFPPMRVGRGGVVAPEFMSILMRNSRSPHYVQGDWQALQAGCQLGVDRIERLVGRWGANAVDETADWIIDVSKERVDAIIDEQIPDGTYRAEHFADGSAIGIPRIKVAAKLEKKGRDLVLDLTGSDDAVSAPLNYIASLPVSRLLMYMQLAVFDMDLAVNEGSLSNLTDLIVRPGSVVSPRFPSPLNSRAVPRAALIECLADLIGQANDGNITAPSPSYVLCHFEFDNGRSLGETLGVGLGARPFGDGPDVIYGSAQRNYPVEQLEPGLPLRVERYEIRRDSGGPGRYRGGCGVLRKIRVLADGRFSPRVGNTVIAAKGMAGGHEGGLARVSVVRLDGRTETYPGVYGDVGVEAGEMVVLETSGGGGWGDPLERPVDDVFRDVRQHFVSVEQARDAYGVWIRNGQVDEQATADGPRRDVRNR